MKPIDKKDQPKLFALIGAAVILFGFAMFQMVSGTGTPAAVAAMRGSAAGKVADTNGAAPSSGPAAGAAGAAGAATLAANAAAPPPAFDPATLGPPTGGKDPFLPLAAVGGATAPLAGKIASTPAVVHPTDGLPIPIARALGKPIGPITFDASPNLEGIPLPGNGGATAVAVSSPVVLPAPQPPAYTVTGVVLGDRSPGGRNGIAILRGGGGSTTPANGTKEASGDRRFVSVGDPVGNGFVVAAVRADGVELQSGRRRVTLKLGNGNNTRAN